MTSAKSADYNVTHMKTYTITVVFYFYLLFLLTYEITNLGIVIMFNPFAASRFDLPIKTIKSLLLKNKWMFEHQDSKMLISYEINMANFHRFGVVGRDNDAQLQEGEHFNNLVGKWLINWTCWHKRTIICFALIQIRSVCHSIKEK